MQVLFCSRPDQGAGTRPARDLRANPTTFNSKGYTQMLRQAGGLLLKLQSTGSVLQQQGGVLAWAANALQAAATGAGTPQEFSSLADRYVDTYDDYVQGVGSAIAASSVDCRRVCVVLCTACPGCTTTAYTFDGALQLHDMTKQLGFNQCHMLL